MDTINPQKIKLLKLYKILRQHTDEDRPLSTNQLCAMLKAEGITCDRRTLAEDINILNASGFEVLRRRTRYAMLFYIVDRRFDLAEVKILIDAIQAASFITKQKTEALTDKVASLAGSYKVAALKGNMITFNTRKHANEAIYYTVDALETALQQKCKASFRYYDLNEHGERVFRKDGERYLVNPIDLVYYEDNYYLVTYHEVHEATGNYRVDRMADVQVEDEPAFEHAIALSSELGTYTERIFKMFNGPQATVELQFDRKLIDAVHDKFGEMIEIVTCKRNLCSATVEVLVSPVFFGLPDLRYSYNPVIDYHVDRIIYGNVKLEISGYSVEYNFSSYAALEAIEEASKQYLKHARSLANVHEVESSRQTNLHEIEPNQTSVKINDVKAYRR